MCGWVAIFGETEPASRLRAAADTLATRGPDGWGERTVEAGPMHAGLAHRRLEVHPREAVEMHTGHRGLESRQLLAQEPGDQASEDITRAARSKGRR